MQFDYFSVHDVPPWASCDEVQRNTVEQFVACEQAGFDSIWLAEHHVGNYGTGGAPSVILANTAGRTKRIRLGSAVSVLPLNHPIRLAEEYATLDLLSGGRLNFGIGRGYTPIEFSVFGQKMEESRERMEESIEIILKAWSEGEFSYRGKHFNIPEVSIYPKPVQRPHPPIFVASSGNQPGVSQHTFEWAVKNGWGVMFAAGRPNHEVREHRERMSQLMTEAGYSRDHVETTMACSPVQKHIYVTPSDEEAIRDNERGVPWFYELLGNRRMFGVTIPAEYDSKPYKWYLENGAALFGCPERVVDQIAKWREEVKADRLMCWMNCGGLPHDKVMRSIRLFAEKVMPKFQ